MEDGKASVVAGGFYDTGPDGETLVYEVERLWRLAADLPVNRVPLAEP